MNKSDEFKKLQNKVIEENKNEEIQKKQKELEFQENRRLELIQYANDDYPIILERFKKHILDGKTKMHIHNKYNFLNGNIHYNNKIIELLKNDGFIVELIHNQGWDESEVSSYQEPFDSIVFYCA